MMLMKMTEAEVRLSLVMKTFSTGATFSKIGIFEEFL
jgi:hypothetical protein